MHLNKKINRLIFFIFSALILSITAACGLLDENDNVGVIPTIAPEFGTASPMPTFTALPTLTPIANPTATPELPLRTIVVFDDEFARGWGVVTEDLLLEDSTELSFDSSFNCLNSPTGVACTP